MWLMTQGQRNSFLAFCRSHFSGNSAAEVLRNASVAGLTVPVTMGTLFLVRLLTRYVPDGPPRPSPPVDVTEEEFEPPAVNSHPFGRVLDVTVVAYKHSLYHKWLHANSKPSVCRFIPSCTEYAVRAVDKHGAVRGLRLTAARFRRCQPDYRGDYVDFP